MGKKNAIIWERIKNESPEIIDKYNGLMFFSLITTDIFILFYVLIWKDTTEYILNVFPDGNVLTYVFTLFLNAFDLFGIFFSGLYDYLRGSNLVFVLFTFLMPAVMLLLKSNKLWLAALSIVILERAVVKNCVKNYINKILVIKGKSIGIDIQSGNSDKLVNKESFFLAIYPITLFFVLQLILGISDWLYWGLYLIDIGANLIISVLPILIIRVCIFCFYVKYIISVIPYMKKLPGKQL